MERGLKSKFQFGVSHGVTLRISLDDNYRSEDPRSQGQVEKNLTKMMLRLD